MRTIVFWNARSFANRSFAVAHYCNSYSPLLLCISESHLGDVEPQSISNYVSFSLPHTRLSGGHLILVRSHVSCRILPSLALAPSPLSSTQISFIELRLPSLTQPLLVALVYIQPDRFATDIDACMACMHRALRRHSHTHHIVVGGDFNCRHPYFGAPVRSTTPGANSFISFVNSHHLHCLNAQYAAGVATFHARRSSSVLDLAFTSSPAFVSDMFVDTHSDLLSDHLPIVVTLTNATGHSDAAADAAGAAGCRTRWNVDGVDWNAYQLHLAASLQSWHRHWDESYFHAPSSVPNDVIEAAWHDLHLLILASATQHVPVARQRAGKRRLHAWWKFEPSLSACYQRMKQLYRRFRRCHDDAGRQQYKQARFDFHELRRSAIEKMHNQRNSRIASSAHSHSVDWDSWRDTFGRRHRDAAASDRLLSVVNANGELPASATQALDNVAAYYHSTFQLHPHRHPHHRDTDLPCLFGVSMADMHASASLEDEAFDYDDIAHACLHVYTRTSTGPDDIHGAFVTHGGPALFTAFHKLFNYSWRHGVLPRAWRDALVTAIYKNKGSHNDACNYRPAFAGLSHQLFRKFHDCSCGHFPLSLAMQRTCLQCVR